ncbi:hypothetical protein [Sporosalibacterium faouarense]|nr:hypothetical protein [Sporosalibacterium faouarense]
MSFKIIDDVISKLLKKPNIEEEYDKIGGIYDSCKTKTQREVQKKEKK